ncbi:uncharacterized protein LOC116607312 [Nematostella vectensis]|uniref:uncharacterized protein LOC116607312 n=1 Tax=Nematostella vectensis TaxID=45351 RepID=UPI002077491D|nr:uncharacterized protein LOC116607312 [Nematostella vectensis]
MPVGEAVTLKRKDGFRYIVFDFEAQHLAAGHVVNFAGVQKMCHVCCEWPTDAGDCPRCVPRRYSFNTAEAYCVWLFGGSNERYTCLAHNFKGYDSYSILEYLILHGVKPNVILNGGKVMCLSVPELKVTMKCTLNFFQMALSRLPKIFGFEDVACKGTPHFFNTPEHQGYKGPIPDLSYYDLPSKSQFKAEALRVWHAEQVRQGVRWVLKDQLAEYCHQDVEVLKRAVLAFRRLVFPLTTVDPFEDCVTIASLASRYRSQRDGVALQTILSAQGEFRVGSYKVDGYAAATGTVYEYYGCFYHGWPQCFDPETLNPHKHLTMGELHTNTLDRREAILAQGYEMVEVDFYSLYQWVNFDEPYPLGHPEIINEQFEEDLTVYRGLLKLKILPPRDLYFPVLPVHLRHKLVFPLCAACAKAVVQGACPHTEKEELALMETWCHPEVGDALRQGYRVLTVYEI